MRILILLVISVLASNACAQSNNKITSKKTQKMELTKISNENLKKAIAALQANHKSAWHSYFTSDAIFTDDGRTLSFKSFFDNAFDKKEKFLDIDKVANEGKDIYGQFQAGQWGTFRFFLNFIKMQKENLTD